MIVLNQVSMAYGERLLFYDVSLNLNSGKCYALVGANGSGKSTFFRIITGEETLTSGEIIKPKDATVGWLKQDQFRYEETLIKNIVLQGKLPLWDALQERESLLASDHWDDKKGFRFAALEEVIAHHDGYSAEAKAETILTGLGIASDYLQKPLNALLGGYKLRVLLAQTLFQSPAILLLDEPTNHLDFLSIRWLEKYLKNEYKGLVVFISHDLEFIDKLADSILDLDYGEIRPYSGRYKKFLAEKHLLEEQRTLEKKSAEAKIVEMQKFVDRFKAKASKAAQARSRMKMIEKIKIPDVKHSSRVAPHFNFLPKKTSGKQVIQAKDLSKSFKGKTLFERFNLRIDRGEKVAILGVNGIGKSTLIKILTGMLQADSGELTVGYEVHMSYFSQDHHELLNRSKSVLSWLTDSINGVTEQQIRRVLGQMLFVKEDVEKDILALSGGEAGRLLLAKIILESPNLLVLDEPTNHMDLETIEALAQALVQYMNTVIFVSHNRHFVDKIATRILYFDAKKGIIDYKGSYTEFAQRYLTVFPITA